LWLIGHLRLARFYDRVIRIPAEMRGDPLVHPPAPIAVGVGSSGACTHEPPNSHDATADARGPATANDRAE